MAAQIVVFAAAVAASVTGYGFVVLSAPLLALLIPPHHVVPLTLALGWLLVSALLLQRGVWRAVDRPLAARLALAGLVGIPLGSTLLTWLTSDTLRLALGLTTAAFTLATLAASGSPTRHTGARLTHGSSPTVYAVGLVSGVLSSSVGLNGPPVALYLAAQGTPKHVFRATSAATVWVITTATLVEFTVFARFPPELTGAAVALLPALGLGVALGVLVFRDLSRQRFQQASLMLAAAAGVLTALVGALVR